MQETYTRRHERLKQYWQGLCGTHRFPSESRVDPAVIAEIWDYCFLVTVKQDGRASGYHYSYLGKSLLEVYGYDPSESGVVETLVDPHSTRLIPKLDEVCRTGVPVTDVGQFINNAHVEIRYRYCLLPLSGENPDEVAFILGTMDWKGY